MAPEALLVSAVLLAFGVAWGVTRACCQPGSWLHFLDMPNERSLHATPTPRTGGVGVMAGVLAAGAWVALLGRPGWAEAIALPGAGLLASLGLVDDRRSLSARVRLLGQVAVAALFLALAGFPLHWWEWPLLGLGLVWMSNLYNFMDGSDGLAGGMALFGFSFLAAAAWLAGEAGLAALAASVAAAAAGFLCFNLHPARIFMGDVGSVPLGFLAGALGIAGWARGAWPLWFPLLVFAPFILDATVTLAKRALRGERVWQAHRSHYYQRLVRLGLGHRRTAWLAYALMAGAGGAGLLALSSGFSLQCIIITMILLVHLLLGSWIDRAWRCHEAGS